MEIGDIVRPTREWYEKEVIDRLRRGYSLPSDVFFDTHEAKSERIKQAEDYYEKCFGVITRANGGFYVKWLNKTPSSVLLHAAWWSEHELELVEKRHPYWEKYIGE